METDGVGDLIGKEVLENPEDAEIHTCADGAKNRIQDEVSVFLIEILYLLVHGINRDMNGSLRLRMNGRVRDDDSGDNDGFRPCGVPLLGSSLRWKGRALRALFLSRKGCVRPKDDGFVQMGSQRHSQA